MVQGNFEEDYLDEDHDEGLNKQGLVVLGTRVEEYPVEEKSHTISSLRFVSSPMSKAHHHLPTRPPPPIPCSFVSATL